MALKRVTIKDLIGSGSAALNRILADGYTPTRNEFEDAVLDLTTAGGFIRPDVNLEDRQVALELPRSDLDAVVLPLLALDLHVAVEDVLAERAQDEL
jgi:hypothetical protein